MCNFLRFRDHRKWLCGDRAGENTLLLPPNFLGDNFSMQVIHIPYFKSLNLTARKISQYRESDLGCTYRYKQKDSVHSVQPKSNLDFKLQVCDVC